MATRGEVVELVRGVQDERDELLDLLRLVADSDTGRTIPADGASVVHIPDAVMAEIRRRVN